MDVGIIAAQSGLVVSFGLEAEAADDRKKM